MGENNVKEIKCESVKDFIQKISYNGELYKLIGRRYIYRGESSDKYDLIPSALRVNNHKHLVDLVKEACPSFDCPNENSESYQIIAEYISLYEFYLLSDYRGLHIPNIPDFRTKLIGSTNIANLLNSKKTWLPMEYFEIAGLAQHYGTCTRLLDWSRDINVAIYFAISGLMKFKDSEKTKNIVLWILDTSAFKAPEGNTSGIILYTPEYAGNPNLSAQKGVFSINCISNNYEESYKETLVESGMNLIMKSVDPEHSESKIKDKEVKPFNEIIKEIKREENTSNDEPILYKILIPTPQDDELYNYLSKEDYDASLIFPGYDGVTKTIKDELYWKKLKRKNEQESK